MARSTLPPIVWVATCGHRNEVRSDHGGYATDCKTCGTKVWVPKLGAGRRYASDELLKYYSAHHRPTAASFRGTDTRVVPRATEPKRRQYGVRGHPSLAAARRRERQAA